MQWEHEGARHGGRQAATAQTNFSSTWLGLAFSLPQAASQTLALSLCLGSGKADPLPAPCPSPSGLKGKPRLASHLLEGLALSLRSSVVGHPSPPRKPQLHLGSHSPGASSSGRRQRVLQALCHPHQ